MIHREFTVDENLWKLPKIVIFGRNWQFSVIWLSKMSRFDNFANFLISNTNFSLMSTISEKIVHFQHYVIFVHLNFDLELESSAHTPLYFDYWIDWGISKVTDAVRLMGIFKPSIFLVQLIVSPINTIWRDTRATKCRNRKSKTLLSEKIDMEKISTRQKNFKKLHLTKNRPNKVQTFSKFQIGSRVWNL